MSLIVLYFDLKLALSEKESCFIWFFTMITFNFVFMLSDMELIWFRALTGNEDFFFNKNVDMLK